MRNSIGILIFAITVNLIIISCDKETDAINIKSGFSIEFSDGTIINEKDILFYDSSTCILFLKNEIYLSYKESFGSMLSCEFAVFIDNDTIYKGIIIPYRTSMMPPAAYTIIRDESYYDKSVLPIEISLDSVDLRNDLRIISVLEKSYLLNHGISFTIDSVSVSPNYIPDSNYINKISCVITIKNNDLINYYILDPKKMGESYYSLYNRGLKLLNKATDYTTGFDGIYHSEYGNITIDDFSILTGGNEVTYKFSSSDYPQILSGLYKCSLSLRYSGSYLDLEQADGRIWIGQVNSSIDNVIIDVE